MTRPKNLGWMGSRDCGYCGDRFRLKCLQQRYCSESCQVRDWRQRTGYVQPRRRRRRAARLDGLLAVYERLSPWMSPCRSAIAARQCGRFPGWRSTSPSEDIAAAESVMKSRTLCRHREPCRHRRIPAGQPRPRPALDRNETASRNRGSWSLLRRPFRGRCAGDRAAAWPRCSWTRGCQCARLARRHHCETSGSSVLASRCLVSVQKAIRATTNPGEG